MFWQLQQLPRTWLKPAMEIVPLVPTHQPISQSGHAGLPPGTTALRHIPSGSGGETFSMDLKDYSGSRLQIIHGWDMHEQTSSYDPRLPPEIYSFNRVSQLPLGERQHWMDNLPQTQLNNLRLQKAQDKLWVSNTVFVMKSQNKRGLGANPRSTQSQCP